MSGPPALLPKSEPLGVTNSLGSGKAPAQLLVNTSWGVRDYEGKDSRTNGLALDPQDYLGVLVCTHGFRYI